jgi:hypothetical protein
LAEAKAMKRKSRGKKTPTNTPLPTQDHVVEYSKSLLFSGLYHLAAKAAVRAGDGDAMRNDWRLQLIHFCNNTRHVYLFITTHFLVG